MEMMDSIKKMLSHPERSRFSGGERDLARSFRELWRFARDPLRLRSGQALGPLEKTRARGMTQLGGSQRCGCERGCDGNDGFNQKNAESSRTKPLFRRREGSRE